MSCNIFFNGDNFCIKLFASVESWLGTFNHKQAGGVGILFHYWIHVPFSLFYSYDQSTSNLVWQLSAHFQLNMQIVEKTLPRY